MKPFWRRSVPVDKNLDAIVRIAASVLADNSMLQFRESEVGGGGGVKLLVTKVSKLYGHNVRASVMDGLVTLYGDDADYAASDVVVLRFGVQSGVSS